LAKGLCGLGYEIENNPRAFEIKGVPSSVINRISKRHRQIDEETALLIARDGESGNMDELREHIALSKRHRKLGNSTAYVVEAAIIRAGGGGKRRKSCADSSGSRAS
jgi:hypothetical protein